MTENSVIEAAKRPIEAYGKKDWKAIRQAVNPDLSYDEVGTHRQLEGVDAVVAAWQGWAAALPDSKATIEATYVSGDNVVIELTWRGHHTGPLETPDGTLHATGKPIELRACQVIGMENGKPSSIRQYFDMATLLQQIGAPKAAKPQAARHFTPSMAH